MPEVFYYEAAFLRDCCVINIQRVSVLVDNESWILPYANRLVAWCEQNGFHATLVRDQEMLKPSDICFLLGCVKIVTQKNLQKSKRNLVVHESDLPRGKGFAPVAWQILEGKQKIPVCLIDASEKVDGGNIWLKKFILLEGHELHDEWRSMQGELTVSLCQEFLETYESLKPQQQVGEESSYPRRRPSDSELNVEKSIAEQFELMRIVDNDHYPAFFYFRGKKFKLEISEADE